MDQKSYRDTLVESLHRCFSVDKGIVRATLNSHGWNVDKVLAVLQHLSPKCQPAKNTKEQAKAGTSKSAGPPKLPNAKAKVPNTQSKVQVKNNSQVKPSNSGKNIKVPPNKAVSGDWVMVSKESKDQKKKKRPSNTIPPLIPQSGIKSSMFAPNNAPPIIRSEEVVGQTEDKKRRRALLKSHFDIIKQKSDPVNRIRDYLKYEIKVMILMRGCPGSGKSTMARQMLISNGLVSPEDHIFSADDFFLVNGQYRYDSSKIDNAHTWNQDIVSRAMKVGLSPVLVDNTHIRIWEMASCARLAIKYGYVVEVVEPTTPWFFNESILARKNTHGVPKNKIEEMLGRYEANVTGISLLQSLQLQYNPAQCPPQLVQAPDAAALEGIYKGNSKPRVQKSPLQEESDLVTVESVCFTDSSNDVNSTSLLDLDGPSVSEPVLPFTSNFTPLPDSNLGLLSEITGPLEPALDHNATSSQNGAPISSVPIPSGTQPSLLSGQQTENANDTDEDNAAAQFEDPLSSASGQEFETASALEENLALDEETSKKIEMLIEIFPQAEPSHIWKLYKENDENWSTTFFILQSNFESEYSSNSPNMERAKSFEELGSEDETSSNPAEETGQEVSEVPLPLQGDDTEYLLPNVELLAKLYPTIPQEMISDILNNSADDPSVAIATLNAMRDIAHEDESSSDPKESSKSDDESNDGVTVNSLKDALQNVLPSVSSAVSKLGLWSNDVIDAKANVTPAEPKEQRLQTHEIDEGPLRSAATNTNYRKKFVAAGDADVKLNFSVNDESFSEHVKRIRKQRLGIIPVDEPQIHNEEESGNYVSATDDWVVGETSNTSADSGGESNKDEKNDESGVESTITLAIGSDIVRQLQEQFGGLGPGTGVASKVWVSLPVDLARQLHCYVMDSLSNNFEVEQDSLDAMIREDEMLARQMQAMEGSIEEGIPSFQEIMDKELAMNLHRSLNKEPSKRDTMAGKLSEQLLIERFPTMDPAALKSILEDADHSLHQATHLLEAAGYSPTNPPSSQDEPEDNRLSREEVVQQAAAYKEAAQVLFDLRNECIAKAQKAYNDGLKSVASYYSQMARWHEERLGQANVLASKLLLESSRDGATLDLHFLRVRDAIHVLDLFLDAQARQLSELRLRKRELFIITGRGQHSAGGVSKIRPAVLNRLRQRGVAAEQINPGLFKVTVTPKTVLTCQNNQ